MNLSKKIIIFFLVFAIVANLSLGIFEHKPRVSLMAELLMQVQAITVIQRNTPVGGNSFQPTAGPAGGGGTGKSAVCTAAVQVLGNGMSSAFLCDMASLVEQIYDRIAAAISKIEAKWALAMRDIIAKRIMDYIVDQTVKWIQGGGKPKFIGNWNGFLKDVGDIAFDSVAKDLGLANLCSPFGLQLKLAFLPVEKFSQRINCSLDQFVKNIQNFYVDFSVGGWEGYLVSLEPNNNLYGAMILANDEAVKRVIEQKQAAGQEAVASKGFFGAKKCKAGSNLSGMIDEGIQHTDLDNQCIIDNQQCLKSAEKLPEYEEQCTKVYNSCIAGAKNSFAKSAGVVSDGSGGYCESKDLINVTPGSIAGEAVADAITSDSKWAASIQSWTSALVNAVINRFIQKGLADMTSSETATPSRYYPPEYQQMVNQQKLQDDLTLINQIEPMQNEWNTLLTQKGNSLVYAREILTTLQQLQASNCTSTNGQLVTTADIDNASSTIDNLQLEVAFLQTNLDAAQSIIDQINSAQTDTEKAVASFAFNNFLTIYNTYALQSQILDRSAYDAANQQSADLLKQLEGENVLDPITNQLVNNGLRTRLSQCRAPAAEPQIP